MVGVLFIRIFANTVAIRKLNIQECLALTPDIAILDVRSPAEYAHAHIPGALSLPLFTNDERAQIGTAYKQRSRQQAIKIGLESFGKNLVSIIEQVEKITAKSSSKEVLVHCWRGGMRSAAVAWLLDLYGFNVNVLTGGYKSYRGWTLEQFNKTYQLKILSGYTGSNKTVLLQELKKNGGNVIDLEAIARHRGSAFGNLDLLPQPSQEHFENELALQLFRCNTLNSEIWLEGESQRIGTINIPPHFHAAMRAAPMVFLEIPFEARLENIVKDYGKHDKEKIVNAIIRIKKRLGGLETKNAINYLLEDDITNCFSILLKYYDKLYLKSTQNNEFKERDIIYVVSNTINTQVNLEMILKYIDGRN